MHWAKSNKYDSFFGINFAETKIKGSDKVLVLLLISSGWWMMDNVRLDSDQLAILYLRFQSLVVQKLAHIFNEFTCMYIASMHIFRSWYFARSKCWIIYFYEICIYRPIDIYFYKRSTS